MYRSYRTVPFEIACHACDNHVLLHCEKFLMLMASLFLAALVSTFNYHLSYVIFWSLCLVSNYSFIQFLWLGKLFSIWLSESLLPFTVFQWNFLISKIQYLSSAVLDFLPVGRLVDFHMIHVMFIYGSHVTVTPTNSFTSATLSSETNGSTFIFIWWLTWIMS